MDVPVDRPVPVDAPAPVDMVVPVDVPVPVEAPLLIDPVPVVRASIAAPDAVLVAPVEPTLAVVASRSSRRVASVCTIEVVVSIDVAGAVRSPHAETLQATMATLEKPSTVATISIRRKFRFMSHSMVLPPAATTAPVVPCGQRRRASRLPATIGIAW